MQPISRIVRPDGIIELTVVEEKTFLFFYRRKIKTTYLGKPTYSGRKGASKAIKKKNTKLIWYKNRKAVSANKSEILSVLSEFYNIE